MVIFFNLLGLWLKNRTPELFCLPRGCCNLICGMWWIWVKWQSYLNSWNVDPTEHFEAYIYLSGAYWVKELLFPSHFPLWHEKEGFLETVYLNYRTTVEAHVFVEYFLYRHVQSFSECLFSSSDFIEINGVYSQSGINSIFLVITKWDGDIRLWHL